jgi:hypothetical protein
MLNWCLFGFNHSFSCPLHNRLRALVGSAMHLVRYCINFSLFSLNSLLIIGKLPIKKELPRRLLEDHLQ